MNFQKKRAENSKLPAGNATTIIAAGTTCAGHLHSSNDLRIDGSVAADITCESKVVIGQNGEVTGNIICQQADVSGKIWGNLHGTEKLLLRQGACINGNITTTMLQMEQAVVFNGQCTMGLRDANSSAGTAITGETVSFVSEHAN